MANPGLKAPIVLVHGILGFDKLAVGGVTIGDYFRAVGEALRAAGNAVPEPPRLNPAGSIEERAADLRTYLEAGDLAGRSVHLLAHSMGGLDSRYLISQLGMGDRVMSLTTIGTPHRGTPFADRGVGALRPLIDGLLQQGIDIRGFFDLTTAKAAEFNARTPDVPGVRYFSVAGQFEPTLVDLLRLPHDLIVEDGGGPNDGLVPVASASYARFLGVWRADHFRLINWATNILVPPLELEDGTILANYLAVVQQLADEGVER
jgi:triacylglycerol lipase